MSKREAKIGAKQFSEILGPWCPSGIESSVEMEEILSANPSLFDAVEESVGLLLQELCLDYDEGQVHGKFYTSSIHVPKEDKSFDTYYLVVVTNGDPGIPKGRALLLLPEELMANETLWKLIPEENRAGIESIVARKAGEKH